MAGSPPTCVRDLHPPITGKSQSFRYWYNMNDPSARRPAYRSAETKAEHLQQEAVMLAEAERQIADGQGIAGRELEKFLDWFVSAAVSEAPRHFDPD